MSKKVEREIQNIQETIAKRKRDLKYAEEYSTGSVGIFAREFHIDRLDFLTVIAAVFFIIVAVFGVVTPIVLPALFFGIALLITTAIKDHIYQIGVLGFTVIYWVGVLLFGITADVFEISLFIFGINTISLGVFIVGSIAVASASVLGFVEGVYHTHRWAGVIMLVMSIALGLVDFFFAVYVFALSIADASWVVIANMGIYAICLVITYGIFYSLARFYKRTSELYNEVGTL